MQLQHSAQVPRSPPQELWNSSSSSKARAAAAAAARAGRARMASPSYNLKNPAVKRIMQEIKEVQADTSGDFMAEALEVWHPSLSGEQIALHGRGLPTLADRRRSGAARQQHHQNFSRRKQANGVAARGVRAASSGLHLSICSTAPKGVARGPCPWTLLHAQNDIFEWHFAIRGPADTEFEVGAVSRPCREPRRQAGQRGAHGQQQHTNVPMYICCTRRAASTTGASCSRPSTPSRCAARGAGVRCGSAALQLPASWKACVEGMGDCCCARPLDDPHAAPGLHDAHAQRAL